MKKIVTCLIAFIFVLLLLLLLFNAANTDFEKEISSIVNDIL